MTKNFEDMTPAEHWDKVKDIAAALKAQIEDLNDLLKK